MRLAFFKNRGRASATASRRRGFAVLIVLVLLACMLIVALSNADTLHSLKKELKLIDAQQQEKYGQGAGH
jgi:hypothetical protein